MLPVPRRSRVRPRFGLRSLFGAAAAFALLGGALRFALLCSRCCAGDVQHRSFLLPADRHAVAAGVGAAGGDSRSDRLAVIIPYRSRPDHLAAMLPVTIDCLRRSRADFSIFVVEQVPIAVNRFTADRLMCGTIADCCGTTPTRRGAHSCPLQDTRGSNA